MFALRFLNCQYKQGSIRTEGYKLVLVAVANVALAVLLIPEIHHTPALHNRLTDHVANNIRDIQDVLKLQIGYHSRIWGSFDGDLDGSYAENLEATSHADSFKR